MTPSPVMARTWPRFCIAATMARFWCGETRPKMAEASMASASSSMSSGNFRYRTMPDYGTMRNIVVASTIPLRVEHHDIDIVIAVRIDPAHAPGRLKAAFPEPQFYLHEAFAARSHC